MSEGNIAEMVRAIRGKRVEIEDEQIAFIAEVESMDPFIVNLNDISIKKNIYINPAYLMEVDETIFENGTLQTACVPFLKNFHASFVLRKGDTVLVYRIGNLFYVMEKVVLA